MSEATSSRIRWNATELKDVAEAMAKLLAVEPGMHLLAAARKAQERVIAKDRQRELKAWSVLEPQVGELLAQAQEAMKAQPNASTDEVTALPTSEVQTAQEQSAPEGVQVAPHQAGDDADPKPAATQHSDLTASAAAAVVVKDRGEAPRRERPPSPDAGQLGATLALSVEAALLVALQSSAVEDALTAVFARAFKRAVDDRETASVPAAGGGQRADQRILLAGFPAPLAKGLEDALKGDFDVRRWNPNQGPQVFETLARMCSIAVIPEEADEEMGQAFSGREMRVVRHQGSVSRLAERLSALAA